MRTKARSAPSLNNSRVSVAPGESMEELTQKAEDLEARLDTDFKLSEEDLDEKKRLLNEGFPDWIRKDFKCFCSSMEKHGRYDIVSIVDDVAAEVGKAEEDVKKYYIAFWSNFERIADHKRIIDRIEKGEKKILRLRQIRDSINEKVDRHLKEKFREIYKGIDALKKQEEAAAAATTSTSSTPSKRSSSPKPKGTPKKPTPIPDVPTPDQLLQYTWPTIKFNYGQNWKGYRAYTEEEDAFLLYCMWKHGFGMAERIRMEIRRAWQFRFDWFFKSRNAQEIQKRCEAVVRLIEKENDEIRKKKEQAAQKAIIEDQKKKAEAAAAKAQAEKAQAEGAQAASSGDQQGDAQPQPMDVSA